MNDDLRLTDEQLHLAMSRSLTEGTTLDPETAAAREGFLALGAALEAAGCRFDEAALVARLKESCTVGLRKPAGREWWTIVLSGALAATALIAVVRISFIAQGNSGVVAITKTPGVASLADRSTQAFVLAAGWNDPLDEEIALAAATIERFSSHRLDFDGSLWEMNQQLEALSLELSGESL